MSGEIVTFDGGETVGLSGALGVLPRGAGARASHAPARLTCSSPASPFSSRAGEFNELRVVTDQQWDSLEAMIRAGNKKKA
jgi:hypothetical protein